MVTEARRARRARTREATRAAILEAAHRVAAREGARNLSLRAAAAEAGFAPAALYSYFTSRDELLLARSDYVQPFGTFSGTLPGGAELARGYGVMEDHRARW